MANKTNVSSQPNESGNESSGFSKRFWWWLLIPSYVLGFGVLLLVIIDCFCTKFCIPQTMRILLIISGMILIIAHLIAYCLLYRWMQEKEIRKKELALENKKIRDLNKDLPKR